MAQEFYTAGSFECLSGPAKNMGRTPSKMKLCLTCCDREFLRDLISAIAQDQDCYWVKVSQQAKDGMYFARCFFTSDDLAGRMWAKYKAHPRLSVNLQDDEFVKPFRESVVSWKTDAP